VIIVAKRTIVDRVKIRTVSTSFVVTLPRIAVDSLNCEEVDIVVIRKSGKTIVELVPVFEENKNES